MRPQPPCKNCPDLELGCKKNCQEWSDYRTAKEEWDAIVRAEKHRYSEIYDAEFKRKAKEKDRKRRRERR